MAIIKFSQDDTQPFGTGIFVNDQGRSIYTTDPDTARGLQPTPAPPGPADDAPPAPGTSVSYAGDPGSPYANAVAANPGATGSAAVGAPVTPQAAVAKVASVIPPAASAAPGGARTPQAAVSAVTSVIPPIIKSTTTTQQGRKSASVEAQIGNDKAAIGAYGTQLEQSAANTDQRQANAIDAQLAGKTGLQTQAREDIAQAATDKRAADAQVARLQELPDGQIDPDRFVSSLSTGSKIGMAVLAAVSGFASGLRNAGAANSQGAPPDMSVLNVLNRRIDQDIETQKDELAQGRIRKSNLIARAVAKGATAEQAETVARGQLWQLAGQVGELQAQKMNLQGAQLDAAKTAFAAINMQASQRFGDLRTQEEARIATSRETETGKPVAGQSGQILELQSKALENYNKAIDNGTDPDAAYQQSGMQVLGLAKPTGQSKEQRAAATKASERTEDQGKTAAVQAAGDMLAKARGFVNPDGNWVPGGKPGTASEQAAAEAAFRSALRANGFDQKAIDATTPQTPGFGSAVLDALPFGFLFSNSTTPEDQATQLNATQSTLRPRLNPQDRGAARGAAALGFKPVP